LTDSQIVPYIPYGQGFALNGTKSLVKLKTLNVGKFPFSKRTPVSSSGARRRRRAGRLSAG
ncbi:hypothetical protein, partial [Enterobacter asburiae]|uniref:hypothetical protein n=1 Tax=Enterobacter asburiae TaxID=61645 RepID=UPI0039C30DF2